MEVTRTARLGQNPDRNGYFVEFRHPKRLDSKGKFGKKIRRGLGTDRENAEAVLRDLQAILSDEYWWSFDRKAEAESKFTEKLAVTIFYDGMEPAPADFAATRNRIIPLPDRGAKQPHAFILPLGPSGAGKSTLDRQLLGTDPVKDRFPATATVKTTTYESEIIIDEGEFEAVVTFLPRDQVRDLIEDCVAAAAHARVESSDPHEPVRKLLEHTEERFRLRYILGDFPAPKKGDALSEFDDPATDPDEDDAVSDDQRQRWAEGLGKHLAAIDELATEKWAELPKEFAAATTEAEREEWDRVTEGFDVAIREDDRFLDIVDGIERDIVARFGPFVDQMQCTRDRWPVLCSFKHADKTEFVRILKAFTSVSSTRWSTLLTPIVSGLRVKGPFRPDWYVGEGLPRWVLFDTEGLGHDPATATSVPTSITSKYDLVDVILVLDSAKQAMTHAATEAALRSIGSSGHAQKLMLCFSHFDLYHTDLRTAARIDLLRTSVDNVIASIGKSSAGRTAELSLRRVLPHQIFYLGHLDKRLDGKSEASTTGVGKFCISQLRELSNAIAERMRPKPKPTIHPVYHGKHLGFAVQGAAQDFHQRWLALLGFEMHPEYQKAKWQTVKALTRRLAERWADQFGGLAPVANLIQCLQERIQIFLSRPIGWIDDHKKTVPLEDIDEDAKAKAIDAVVATVQNRMHEFTSQRLLTARLGDWAAAYGRSGTGSTRERASDMRDIYEHAVPIPSDAASEDAMRFLDDVAALVEKAVAANGGLLV
jgi:hypothetical protein